MNESAPLYNSRVTKIYIQYLQKFYPEINVDSVLNELGIANYEIEDPAHWFTQEQQDRSKSPQMVTGCMTFWLNTRATVTLPEMPGALQHPPKDWVQPSNMRWA